MTRGTVCGFDGAYMQLRVERAACAACLDGRGCGMGLLAADNKRHRVVNVAYSGPAPSLGDVIILAPPRRLVEAALIAYGLPLAGLLMGAALGDYWVAGPASAAVAVAMMLAAAFVARRIAAARYAAGDLAVVALS